MDVDSSITCESGDTAGEVLAEPRKVFETIQSNSIHFGNLGVFYVTGNFKQVSFITFFFFFFFALHNRELTDLDPSAILVTLLELRSYRLPSLNPVS